METTLTINSFDLKVTKNDEGLHIQAKSPSGFFTKFMNKDTASGLSKDQFFDLDTIFQVFQDHSKPQSQTSSLTLTDDGKLSYTCQVSFGSITKEFGFAFDLEKQEELKVSESHNNLEKLVQDLTKKIAKLEETSVTKEDLEKATQANNQRLEAFEKVVLERFAKIESTLNLAVEKLVELQKERKAHDRDALDVELHFNSKGSFASGFQLSQNDKAAVSVDGFPHSLFSEIALPEKKKSRFRFQILKHEWIMVGVAPEEALANNLAYQNQGTVAYSNDGALFAHGGCVYDKTNLAKYGEGDKVEFEVDLESGIVRVNLNGKYVTEYVIQKEHLQQKFYPFIYTNRKAGCGAMFV